MARRCRVLARSSFRYVYLKARNIHILLKGIPEYSSKEYPHTPQRNTHILLNILSQGARRTLQPGTAGPGAVNLSHELTTSDTPPDPQLPQPLPPAQRPPTAALADPQSPLLTGRQGQGPAPGSGGRRTRPQSGHLMELPGNPRGCPPSRPPSQDTPLTIPRESVQGPGDPKNTLPQSAAAAKGRGCSSTNHSNKLRGEAGICGSPSLGPNFELLTQVGQATRSNQGLN